MGRQFTLGQLFVISWWLNQRLWAEEIDRELGGNAVNLQSMTSAELNQHLRMIGV
jgi:hypothetical protein